MRIVPLHKPGTPVVGTGDGGIDPRTSLVGLIAKVSDPGGGAVSATFSILGSVGTFTPEPITFGGASIISLAGTGSAQWTGRVENQSYEGIALDLLTVSAISFQASASEAEV